MEQHIDLRKAGAVLIRDRKYLVTRSRGKDTFVCPGGKLEPGENDLEALVRELDEELSITVSPEDCELFGTYQANATGSEGKLLEMSVFIVSNYWGNPTPSSEIEELRWVGSITPELKQGSIFEHEVVPRLVELDLID